MIDTIYVDLDGVLFDLEEGYRQQFGYIPGPADGPPDPLFWSNIMGSPTFFRDLPLHKEADQLVYMLRTLQARMGVELEVLTSCSTSWYDSVAEQKRTSVQRHFPGLFSRVNTVKRGKDKALFAASSCDLLIDDTCENVMAFREAGGSAIFYRDFKGFTKEMEALLVPTH